MENNKKGGIMYQGYRIIECLADEKRTPTVVEFDAPILRGRVCDARVKMGFSDFQSIKSRLEKLTSDYEACAGRCTPAYKAREKRLAQKVESLAYDVCIRIYPQ